MILAGLGPENDCAGEANSKCNDRAILSSERMLHINNDRKSSVEKITGRESQGACRQDELIGGKPSV
jgi:hypothetical protein